MVNIIIITNNNLNFICPFLSIQSPSPEDKMKLEYKMLTDDDDNDDCGQIFIFLQKTFQLESKKK